MKIQSTALVLATFAAMGLAHAGSTGAGPGGTGSTAVGTVVPSGTINFALLNSPEPGTVGIIVLSSEQIQAAAQYLRSQQGAIVNGPIISAPTTFQDGTAGVITLDTENGKLTVQRT